MITSISSAQNQVFRELLECLGGRGIRKHGMFIVSGERAVRDLVRGSATLVRDVVLCDGRDSVHDELAGFVRRLAPGAAVLSLSAALFDQLDLFGTRGPLVVMQTPALAEADLTLEPVGLELLCAMGDPANVGAVLRSAAAFGVSRVVMLRESASPFHPKAVRAASAAILATPLVRGPSIRELTCPVIAMDLEGAPLSSFAWPKNARLLIGEEGQGVPALRAMSRVSIPMAAGVESLNATVAASIALYAYRAQVPG